MNKVDRELAEIEARSAEAARTPGAANQKSGMRAAVKRWAKNRVVRRTSTKR